MRITMRASLFVLATFAFAVMPSCGGGSGKTDEKTDVIQDLPGDVPETTGDADAVDVRDVPPADEGVAADDGTVEDEGIGGEDVTEDIPIECPSNFLCPCNYSTECYSGICIDTMDQSICSKQCGLGVDCPPGWTCDEVTVGGEKIYGCIYPFPNLCRPCETDQDCVPKSGAGNKRFLCIDGGAAGKFCGAQCDKSSDCPTYGEGAAKQTFECVPVSTATGDVKQCRPTDGQCPCTPKYQNNGYQTTCYVENEFGKCSGKRTCDVSCAARTPLAEACNLEDDDCNAKIDDNIAPIPCPLTNAYGTCQGLAYCVNGNDRNCQGAYASPEVCNGQDDNCDGFTDEGFPDLDGDKIADCVDPDIDGDGIPNTEDNCPLVANADQLNNDGAEEPAGAKKGDACDDDDDNDGIPDTSDNCPLVKNVDQGDVNGNGKGNACDCDADSDGFPNAAALDMVGGACPDPGPSKDNCTLVANADQLDTNKDGLGDACDCDIDADGIANNNPGCTNVDVPDNCRTVPNSDQADSDLDRIGDACDCDIDNDGVFNNIEGVCPVVAVPDNCTFIANPIDPQTGVQADTDGDLIGDACDCDIDNDGVFNPNPGCPTCTPCDNCPYTVNPGQEPSIGGGEFGAACDDDWDRDGVLNADDNCPRTPNPKDPVSGIQPDLDLDGFGDVCDCDVDGDGIGNDGVDVEGASCPVPPVVDNCARIANVDQADLDLDNIGDACDCDIDGDGDPQPNFECPTPTLPDCEPFNAAVSHLAVEKCNTVDDNCNGLVDEENAEGCTTYYYDKDDDGYGTAQSKCLCKATGFYRALSTGDCNDDEKTINPGVQEVCDNGRDDNCNSSENDLNAIGCTRFYFDGDNDGYGTGDFECRCFQTGGKYKAFQTGDCDDTSAAVNPGKAEICNDGVDNNCSGSQNDENAQNCRWFYYDGDNDTYGTSAQKCFCFANDIEKFTASRAGDCDDSDGGVNPGVAEVCNNSKDDNCDGFQNTEGASGCLTYYYGGDHDNYGITTDSKCLCATQGSYTARDGGDCQDANPNINPGATEICDGIDNNCDTRTDENPRSLCTDLPNATSICQSSQCVIDQCIGTYFNVNGIVSDGCECGQDANDGTGNSCGAAIYLGEAWDNGNALPLVNGRVVPGTDEDWYYVVAKDSADGGGFGNLATDRFNVIATLKQPTDGSIKVDVRRGGCDVGQTCGGVTFQWKATNEAGCISPPSGVAGEFWSCCAPGQCEGGAGGAENACCNDVAQCTDGHNVRHCLDDGATFFIRVYHDPSLPQATKCSETEYSLEVSNGK